MSRYKCIIFDCDGVLVDSEPLSNQVMVELANELGANINLDYAYQHFKGNSFQNCSDKISELIGHPVPKDLEFQYRQRSFEIFKAKIQPIDGVKDLLNSLNMSYCVASSGPENKIQLNLQLTGLLPYFEGKIFSCYTIQKWKPDPSVFHWAAQTMGFNAKDCLVIEDSPIGIEAAINGGFDVFGFTAHDCKDELQKNATKTFDRMNKLLQLLD